MRAWHSIRFRLAALSAAVVTVALVAIGSVVYVRLAHKLEDADEQFARHEALEVAQVVASLTTPEAVRAGLAVAEPRIFPEDDVVGLQVFDLEGGLVGSLPAEAAPAPWPEGFALARAGGAPTGRSAASDGRTGLRAAMLVTYAREPRWLVLSHVDVRKSERTLAETRRHLLLGVPLAAALVFGGAYGLLALALRPLRVLVEDTRAIAAEGLGRRLAQPPPGSELAELARLLNVMLSQLEETVGRLRRFAADASHELRTPLARMRGEAEVALRAGDAAEAREALVSVLDELDSLRRLVDGLLELARGDAERVRGGGSFDLAALAQELGEEARLVGETRGLTVEVERAPGPLLVEGSRDLCGRALWNLMDNALKYVPSGGRIRVSTAHDERGARVTVDDDGPGLPDSLVPHLFQPFVRGDPARWASGGQDGHGLGLALARTIARRSGGDLVCARSSPGASFVLTLPRSKAEGGAV